MPEVGVLPTKCLLVRFSFHHNNADRIAGAFARILNARATEPPEVDIRDLQAYDLGVWLCREQRCFHHAWRRLMRLFERRSLAICQ
jgi:hypothetical protein